MLNDNQPSFIFKYVLDLKAQMYRLGQLSNRFGERDRVLFKTIIESLKKNNREEAEKYAYELKEVRKHRKLIYNTQLAIERVLVGDDKINEDYANPEFALVFSQLKSDLKEIIEWSQKIFPFLPDVSEQLTFACETLTFIFNNACNWKGKDNRVKRNTEANPNELLIEISKFLKSKLLKS